MLILGKSERLYKAVFMDSTHCACYGWHRTVLVEKQDDILALWTTVIKDGTATFTYAHHTKEKAENMLQQLMEQVKSLDVSYVIYDFTSRDNLEDQIAMLKQDNADLTTVIGCTEDELSTSLKWKL